MSIYGALGEQAEYEAFLDTVAHAALEAAERARSAVPSPTEQEHDPRCISLTDSEFNGSCDCRTLRMIDEHDAHRSTEQESER